MAILKTPENRLKPDGMQVELPVIRLKTDNPKPGAPIVYLAGGPGGSGIAALKGNRLAQFLKMRELADVIVFDQRGTGSAKPGLFTRKLLDLPLDKPVDSPEAIESVKNSVGALIDKVQKEGSDISSYNTVENAHDVEALRVALGADKIALWGHSYGTHLGLAYIKLYGNRVERAVFLGTNGPDQRFRYPSDADSILYRMGRLISADAKLRKAIPDFPALVKDVLENLDKHPVTVELEFQKQKTAVLIGKSDVQTTCILNMGETWFIREMPQLFYQMSKGDYTRMGELTLNSIKRRPLGTAMTYAMHCASGCSDARMKKIRAAVGSALFGNAINYPFLAPGFCGQGGIRDLGEAYRAPIKSNVPVLFLSADLDGRTSIDDAEAVRAGFPKGVHLIYENTSHDFANAPIHEPMYRFFKGETLHDGRFKVSDFDFYAPNNAEMTDMLYKKIVEDGPAAFQSAFEALLRSDTYVSATGLVPLCYRLLREDKVQEAVSAMETNLKAFPNSWQNHNALADAYAKAGEPEKAALYYKRSLEMNFLNLNATKALIKK
jgi:pimeloyl-ACP methyl ester carboxylesterase